MIEVDKETFDKILAPLSESRKEQLRAIGKELAEASSKFKIGEV